MERPIKINFPHQTDWDKINDKLWTSYNIVESYKQMWKDSKINHCSKKQQEEIYNQFNEKSNKFHYDFLICCEEVIKYISSEHVFKFKTKENLQKLEDDLEINLLNLVNAWQRYVNPYKLIDILLDTLSDEDISKLRYGSSKSFIEANYNDETALNMERIWRYIFSIYGIDDFQFSKIVDNKIKSLINYEGVLG